MPLSNAACMQIKSLLAEAIHKLSASSPSPDLDADVLLAWVLEKDRSYLRAWCDKSLEPDEFERYSSMLSARLRGIPVAYLTGVREFWSREFIVAPGVLIPRADTELLIERALEFMPEDQALDVIDLGTGCGIIAITLAAERPKAKLIATDKSAIALALARQNADKHHIKNLQLHKSNWFERVPAGLFDLVLSNPPYIAAEDPHLQQGDLRFEPQSALVSDEQGLKDIRLIAEAARGFLKPGGRLLIEHGYNQQQSVQAIFNACGYDDVRTYPDLAGNPRVTAGLKKR